MKNLCNKTRKVDNPYEVWATPDGSWEWKVLKKYQGQVNESKNEYARWFCGVKSPFTYGGHELGDVYVKDIKSHATRIDQ